VLKTIEDIQVEDIQILKNKLSDESEQVTRLYFEKIIDFLKWTTTIALGALLWIGANYHSISNNTLLINTSLASFGLSIMFSFSYVIFILNWMNDTSRLSIERLESTKHLLPSFILAPDAKKPR